MAGQEYPYHGDPVTLASIADSAPRTRTGEGLNGWVLIDRVLRRKSGESKLRYLSGGPLEIIVYNGLAWFANFRKRTSSKSSR